MTLKWNAKGYFFLAISIITLIWFDLEFGVVTQVKEKHVSRGGGQPRLHPKGAGPSVPPPKGDLLHARVETKTTFCMMIGLDVRTNFTRSTTNADARSFAVASLLVQYC